MGSEGARAGLRQVFRRLSSFGAVFLAASCCLSCIYTPNNSSVQPPIERAMIREQRIAKNGSLGASYDLASYSGTSDKPCLKVWAAKDAAASADVSILLLSHETSEATSVSSGGYYYSFWSSSYPYSLVARKGSAVFSKDAGDGTSLDTSLAVAFDEPRCLIVGNVDAVSYSITASGLVEVARKASSGLTGDNRYFLGSVAIPGGGYAAIARDNLLFSDVCTFLGDDLGGRGSFKTDKIYWYSELGSSGGGLVYGLSFPDQGAYVLTLIDLGAGTTTNTGSLPDVNSYWYSISWAGDRFWVADSRSATIASVTVVGGAAAAYASPIDLTSGYDIKGLPDGGLLIFGPLEPTRDSGGPSPPYARDKLRVWRYGPSFQLLWKAEWMPDAPSRILNAAGDGDGVSVFICARP